MNYLSTPESKANIVGAHYPLRHRKLYPVYRNGDRQEMSFKIYLNLLQKFFSLL